MKPAEDEPSALLCFGPWLVVPGGCAWWFGFARRQQGVRPMPVWLGAASPCTVRQASPCACRVGSGSLFSPVGRGCRWGSTPSRLAQGLCPAQQAAGQSLGSGTQFLAGELLSVGASPRGRGTAGCVCLPY